MYTRRLACLVLVSLIAACGGDSGDPTDPGGLGEGAFEATVSGSVNSSFTGAAAFSSMAGEGFLLSLVDDAGAHHIYLYRASVGRPGTGTFQVGAASDNGGHAGVYAVGFTGNKHIFSTSGTLRITNSATGSLAGTLSFDGHDLDGGAVAGNATFRATCFAVLVGMCD